MRYRDRGQEAAPEPLMLAAASAPPTSDSARVRTPLLTPLSSARKVTLPVRKQFAMPLPTRLDQVVAITATDVTARAGTVSLAAGLQGPKAARTTTA